MVFTPVRATRSWMLIRVALVASQVASPTRVEAASKRPRDAARSKGATLLVRSTTTGASVLVDDVEVGTVPMLKPVTVQPGKHIVKVVKRGHVPYLDTFEAQRGQAGVLEVDLLAVSAGLDVRANVADAVVALDQRPIGAVPFSGDVPPGTKTLEVRAPGWLTHKQSVELSAGEVYTYDLTLVAAPPGYDEGPTPWYGHWWVWTGAAVVVAGGVTAAIVASRAPSEAPAGPSERLPLEWVR